MHLHNHISTIPNKLFQMMRSSTPKKYSVFFCMVGRISYHYIYDVVTGGHCLLLFSSALWGASWWPLGPERRPFASLWVNFLYKATPMSITHWQSNMHHRDSLRVTRAGSTFSIADRPIILMCISTINIITETFSIQYSALSLCG